MKTRRDSPWLALGLLTCAATLGFIDRIIINVLVEPIKHEFGLSDTQMGYLTGLAFAAIYVFLSLAVARYAERRMRVPLIAFGIFAWSIATAMCGAVGSWIQLLFARMGVGVGEAIGLPANQSVIADYFPPEKRATAMSVLLLSPPIGVFIGSIGGSWIGQEYGWREAFVAAAIPGIALSILVFLFVAEPPRGRHDKGDVDTVPPFSAVLARFVGLPSARHLVAGSGIASMVAFGLSAFFAALMMRRFGLTLVEAGLYAGLLASIPATISVFAGGWLSDRLGAKNPAAYALIPGVSFLIALPLYTFGITRADDVLLMALVTVAALFQYTYLGITFGTLQNMMQTRMRATASALLNMIFAIMGGLGPVLVGAMSDFWQSEGIDPGRALAWAMAATCVFYLWASAHYLIAARHVGADLARTRDGAF